MVEDTKIICDLPESEGGGNVAPTALELVSEEARKHFLEAVWRRTEANCPVLLIHQDHVPTNVRFEINQR